MKKIKTTFIILFTTLLIGCTIDGRNGNGFNNDFDTETWEKRPFYGELRFEVMDAKTHDPITDATMQVMHLYVIDSNENGLFQADENGRFTMHQFERGITYMGEGPPQPTITFEAPGYTSHKYSVDELAAPSGYDPYSNAGLPTTEYIDEDGDTKEVPLYEFTIFLTCEANSCGAPANK